MWPSNLLTERLSLKFPIILAPMGIITTPALAAAVSNAGGLGGIRAALAQADDACTVVTDVISGRPARYIKNKLIDDLTASGLKPLPIPAQLSLTFPLGAGGDREFAVLLSGQSAALAKDTNATELVERLAEETTRRLRAFV